MLAFAISIIPFFCLAVVDTVKKRKFINLNFDQRLKVIDVKIRKEVAKQYGCNLSTIACIMQQEEKIKGMAQENKNT